MNKECGVNMEKSKQMLRESSPYSAAITREQFLYYEMRTTARLFCEGLTEREIIDRIERENLFQYPTEKMLRNIASACVRRLKAMNDPDLITAIAVQPSDTAKQICLYAMMKQYRLVWDFMVTVIGSKYESCDMSFGKRDLNVFLLRLQEQDDWVATWTETTIAKVKQILTRILVENEFLDRISADHLNPILINPLLENAIRSNGDVKALAAFNCLS